LLRNLRFAVCRAADAPKELTETTNVGWLSAVPFAGGTVVFFRLRQIHSLAARFLACGLSGLWLLAMVVSLSTTN
jgi:hypothetical protein